MLTKAPGLLMHISAAPEEDNMPEQEMPFKVSDFQL